MLLVGDALLTCLDLLADLVLIGQLIQAAHEDLDVLLDFRSTLPNRLADLVDVFEAEFLAALHKVVEVLLGPAAMP